VKSAELLSSVPLRKRLFKNMLTTSTPVRPSRIASQNTETKSKLYLLNYKNNSLYPINNKFLE